jgi:predicted naringenin-chalcone synthase
MRITFSKEGSDMAVELLGGAIDDKGYVIDDMGERILATDGGAIKPEELVSIGKENGQIILIRKFPLFFIGLKPEQS